MANKNRITYLAFALVLLGLVCMGICLTPHVSIQDTHEITPKVSNLSAFHTCQFVNGQECILLSQHSKFHSDLATHFFLSTKAFCDQALNPSVHSRCQGSAHTSFFSCRSAFLDADIPLDDTKEVGPMIANGILLDLDSIIVLRKSIVDKIDRKSSKSLQETSLQQLAVARFGNVYPHWKTVGGRIHGGFGGTRG